MIDYLSLTNIARYKSDDRTDDLVRNWLRNRNTIEFLGVWERLDNPDFNPVEFDGIRVRAGLNSVKSPSGRCKPSPPPSASASLDRPRRRTNERSRESHRRSDHIQKPDFDAADPRRIDELSAKARQGTLTPEERTKL